MSRLYFIAAASYLLGSIPFGYLLVRVFRGEDVRLSGSGNIGATNVSRKSPALGALTLLLDAMKGAAAVTLAIMLSPSFASASIRRTSWGHIPPVAPELAARAALAALFALLGHMFPVWLKFRGGKGVATGLGSFLMIAPKAVLLAAFIFVVVVLVFRYVSLASVVAVAAFPSLVWLLDEYGNEWASLALISLASALIIIRHQANIRRLLAGTEPRFGSRPV